MIAVADDIFAEVEAATSDLNPEIVRRAFLGHCCQFVTHQEEFDRVLRRYTWHRMAIHRLRVDENRFDNYYLSRLGADHYSSIYHHAEMAKCERIELKQIWPCAACIWLYNPTNRLRRFPQLC